MLPVLLLEEDDPQMLAQYSDKISIEILILCFFGVGKATNDLSRVAFLVRFKVNDNCDATSVGGGGGGGGGGEIDGVAICL